MLCEIEGLLILQTGESAKEPPTETVAKPKRTRTKVAIKAEPEIKKEDDVYCAFSNVQMLS